MWRSDTRKISSISPHSGIKEYKPVFESTSTDLHSFQNRQGEHSNAILLDRSDNSPATGYTWDTSFRGCILRFRHLGNTNLRSHGQLDYMYLI
jgi:hypothetical protein